jgi:hypothetical protein
VVTIRGCRVVVKLENESLAGLLDDIAYVQERLSPSERSVSAPRRESALFSEQDKKGRG